jgi:uncharacterized protein DUF4338
MAKHYSQPKGFVGRNICYLVTRNDVIYGSIVGGSSTLHLVGRDSFFKLYKEIKKQALVRIVNNIFYHVEPANGHYPFRNFTQKVLKAFRKQVAIDWEAKYGDSVIGFESLVELPRTGETYKRDGWTEVGTTKGETCKRVAGQGTDSWTGKRVWDTQNLRPKRVFVKWNEENKVPIYIYRCEDGHETELLQLSISQDAPLQTACINGCLKGAIKVDFAQTAPPNTYGDGFHHQSLSGPTRRQDPTKLLNEMKQSGASFETSK